MRRRGLWNSRSGKGSSRSPWSFPAPSGASRTTRRRSDGWARARGSSSRPTASTRSPPARARRRRLVAPPQREPWGGRTIRFTDPDGNEFLAFEVARRRRPRPRVPDPPASDVARRQSGYIPVATSAPSRSAMTEILPGVHQVDGVDPSPDFSTHVYLAEGRRDRRWTLIDCGLPGSERRFAAYLKRHGIAPSSVAKDPPHPPAPGPHGRPQGGRETDEGEDARPLARGGVHRLRPPLRRTRVACRRSRSRLPTGSRTATWSTRFGGLVAYHTPGHTPGHTAYYQPEREDPVLGRPLLRRRPEARPSPRRSTPHDGPRRSCRPATSPAWRRVLLTYHGGPFPKGAGPLVRARWPPASSPPGGRPWTRAVAPEVRESNFVTWRRQGGWAPLVVTRGEGSTFWTDDGRALLDFSSQLVATNLGHSNHAVQEAIARQARELPYAAPGLRPKLRAPSSPKHSGPSFRLPGSTICSSPPRERRRTKPR